LDVAIVTGSSGLIGSEAVRFLSDKGMRVLGVDNDMRREFFGDSASTEWNRECLERDCPSFKHHDLDIRSETEMEADDFAANAETGLQPIILGYRVEEVPISWINRSVDMGFSSFNLTKTGPNYILVLFRLVLRKWFGREIVRPHNRSCGHAADVLDDANIVK
jgi:hypothetical protein